MQTETTKDCKNCGNMNYVIAKLRRFLSYLGTILLIVDLIGVIILMPITFYFTENYFKDGSFSTPLGFVSLFYVFSGFIFMILYKF